MGDDLHRGDGAGLRLAIAFSGWDPFEASGWGTGNHATDSEWHSDNLGDIRRRAGEYSAAHLISDRQYAKLSLPRVEEIAGCVANSPFGLINSSS